MCVGLNVRELNEGRPYNAAHMYIIRKLTTNMDEIGISENTHTMYSQW